MRIRIESLACVVLLIACLAAAAPAETWVRAAGGLSHMAMGDVGGATFQFFDDPGAEATFEDVGVGFVLDLAAGHDFDRSWGVGFHWERQWAGSGATDRGVDGELDLDANYFAGRLYWRPVRGRGWHSGLVAGTGYFFTSGHARITRGGTNYGQERLWGTSWGIDGAVLLSRRLSDAAELHLQLGGRHAVVGEFEVGQRVVTREDGGNAELDYSGWQVKAGVRWRFGEDAPGAGTGL